MDYCESIFSNNDNDFSSILSIDTQQDAPIFITTTIHPTVNNNQPVFIDSRGSLYVKYDNNYIGNNNQYDQQNQFDNILFKNNSHENNWNRSYLEMERTSNLLDSTNSHHANKLPAHFDPQLPLPPISLPILKIRKCNNNFEVQHDEISSSVKDTNNNASISIKKSGVKNDDDDEDDNSDEEDNNTLLTQNIQQQTGSTTTEASSLSSVHSSLCYKLKTTKNYKASSFIKRKFKTKSILRFKRPRYLNAYSVHLMEQWYLAHELDPYPSSSEKQTMAVNGRITLHQVNSWFANRRNRCENTRPKKNRILLNASLRHFAMELEQSSDGRLDASMLAKKLDKMVKKYF